MKSKLMSIIICFVFILSLAVCLYVSRTQMVKSDYVITNKETAIKIGKALLEEHFPDYFAYNGVILGAEETQDTWRVYNVVERSGNTNDGLPFVVLGGEVCAEFRKDGKIIKISLAD